MAGSYCLSKRHITSSLLQRVLKMFAFSTNAKAQTLTPIAISTFNNRVTQSGPARCWCVVSVRRRPTSWYVW